MPATSPSGHAFTFTKWYVDCVCDDGRTAIAYWTVLAWRGLSLTWQALSVWENDRLSVERSTLVRSPMPSGTNGRIAWNAPGLECSIGADACQQPVALRLFQESTGFVDWRSDAPAARVTIEGARFAPLRGLGYVECLELTIPPWQLPIRELRWGRWADPSAAHSIIWIDWRGADEPRTWVFVDGMLTAAAVQDHRVEFATSALTLASVNTLRSRTLDDIARRIPSLRAIAPASLLALREVKWSTAMISQRPVRVRWSPPASRTLHSSWSVCLCCWPCGRSSSTSGCPCQRTGPLAPGRYWRLPASR